ncbi:hypothetical protein LzC2_42410 [Planctomycetes bacterium LzC2]|uniref:Uncharacterized protein n=1 Tax=Alienimonas chondri TaxID=2681879 RepID=A0ABX1VLD7_9PLAN|nr:hypothetical protein [Alienimonas chondri]
MDESRPEPIAEESAAGGAGFDLALGIVGAVVGAVVGVWVFGLIARQGFLAVFLPGALTGLGCGALSGRRSVLLAVISGALGTLAGAVAEWRLAPFKEDDSLGFFLTHLNDLRPFTLGMIVLGGAMAAWFGLGRRGGAGLRRTAVARGR